MTADAAIEIAGLGKTFISGLRRRRTVALRELDLTVAPGEIFGFLGPNGAGKTTAIKILVDLIRADSGSARIFGISSRDRRARRRLAYLPELPNFYDYLNARELLQHLGRLSGLEHNFLRGRVPRLLEKVGLDPGDRRPLRKYSKGMLQRVGIAQAMLADPDLYILDEPMGGLDPLGRRWMKELIAELGRQGKTVFFSSHVLAEAEAVCSRVAFIHRGRLIAQGQLNELLSGGRQEWEIVVAGTKAGNDPSLRQLYHQARSSGSETVFTLGSEHDQQRLLQALLEKGQRVISLNRRHASLEDLFVRLVGGESPAAGSGQVGGSGGN